MERVPQRLRIYRYAFLSGAAWQTVRIWTAVFENGRSSLKRELFGGIIHRDSLEMRFENVDSRLEVSMQELL